LILSGKTTVESNHKVYIYNLGWKQNFLEVFGERWAKAMIWPFTKSGNNSNVRFIILQNFEESEESLRLICDPDEIPIKRISFLKVTAYLKK